MKLYSALARLLDYPTEELLEHMPEIVELVTDDEGVSP